MQKYCDLLTFAGRKHFLLEIQVVFVAFDTAAAALQGWRGLEDVPKRPGAHFTARGEMIECRHKFMTFVGDTRWPVGHWKLHGKLLVFLTLALVIVQDLKTERKRERERECQRKTHRERDQETKKGEIVYVYSPIANDTQSPWQKLFFTEFLVSIYKDLTIGL